MWAKDRSEVTGGSSTDETDEETLESGANVDHAKGTSAFVGKGVKFKGVITYSGTVRIDGQMEGEIKTDGILLIGAEAVISANISAGTIICSGKITGDVKAAKRVTLHSPAVLIGSVEAPTMSMEEGAHLNGKCTMRNLGVFEHEDKKVLHQTVARIEAVATSPKK